MRRIGDLWEELISFKNLLSAAKKACRGKRFRPGVADFHFHLEGELWRLHEELRDRRYQPGEYRSFFIYEPKKRQISAARIGTGWFITRWSTCWSRFMSALSSRTLMQFAGCYRYVLKADIEKFFPCLDHAILKQLLARKIKDPVVTGSGDRLRFQASRPAAALTHALTFSAAAIQLSACLGSRRGPIRGSPHAATITIVMV
jgi:hypothetical protein